MLKEQLAKLQFQNDTAVVFRESHTHTLFLFLGGFFTKLITNATIGIQHLRGKSNPDKELINKYLVQKNT
jgi:hypothetical protein